VSFDFSNPEHVAIAAEMDELLGPWSPVWIVHLPDGRFGSGDVVDEITSRTLEPAASLREAFSGLAHVLAADAFKIKPGESVAVNEPGGFQVRGLPPGKYRLTLGVRSGRTDPSTGKCMLITLFDLPSQVLN
jgi:hypothetical protein